MRLEQKRFSNRTAFEFGEEALTFTLQDKSGSADFEIAYADIPRKASNFEERNAWLRNVGLLWVLIGAIQLGNALYGDAPLSGKGFWLMVGLICLIAYRITVTRYSIYSSDQGKYT